MYFNILVAFVVGLMPFVGAVADAVFRANTRNCWTLEQYLVRKVEAERTEETHGAVHPAPTQAHPAPATADTEPAKTDPAPVAT